MTDISQQEVERLADGHAPSGVVDYDEVLTPLAREVKRLRAEHEVIRAEISTLEFIEEAQRLVGRPSSADSIGRVIAAWHAAEPT